MDEAAKLIDFLHKSEKLQTLLRHSWLSSGRRESVAEHTWRMALMALIINPYLDQKLDLEKTLKIILVHDLVEINYQDHPAFKKPPIDKAEQERKSLLKLLKSLPRNLRQEIIDLWQEYEDNKTLEAKFAKAMDKTEVLLQHNEADLKFLTKKEIPFNMHHGDEYTGFDSFLKLFRDAVRKDTVKYYRKHKLDKKLYES